MTALTAFFASMIAMLPNVLLAVIGKIVTEQFMQAVLEKVLLRGLEKAATLTTNTIDDEVVQDIKKRLQTPPMTGV